MTHTKDRRRAVITEAGSARNALTRPWPEAPLGAQHPPVPGTLNGQPVEFRVTGGAGYHYAYFTALGQIWYVDTGAALLAPGAAIEFVGDRWPSAPVG